MPLALPRGDSTELSLPLVLRWRRQGLTDSTRPEYRFVQESRIHPLGTGPKDLSEFGLLSKSIRLGDAMSLCCFSQEQQQQRQSALLAAGDRAFRVFSGGSREYIFRATGLICRYLSRGLEFTDPPPSLNPRHSLLSPLGIQLQCAEAFSA